MKAIIYVYLTITICQLAFAEKPSDVSENVYIYPNASKLSVLAKQAIVMDFNTGMVLLEKNADERMAPSSMTKMMTAYLLEEKIENGEISNDSEFLVSEKAWRTQGSKMFVQVGDKVKVADLHKGIAIQSGNDASIVVAEGLVGSEEAFATEMNLMAKKLGMNSTNFKNASGLPEEGHASTARDLAKLAIAMIKNHEKFYSINKQLDFTYNGIKQGNRNPLLYSNIGCDGIKTGHTDAGGYGVAASCVDGLQRYVFVINGLDSVQARADEARKLNEWAKSNFIGKVLAKKGDVIEKALKVELGVKDSIPLVAAQDLYLLMLRSEQNKVVLKPFFKQPIVAPVKEGSRLGTLMASLNNNKVQIDLVAPYSVDKLGWFKRILKSAGII